MSRKKFFFHYSPVAGRHRSRHHSCCLHSGGLGAAPIIVIVVHVDVGGYSFTSCLALCEATVRVGIVRFVLCRAQDVRCQVDDVELYFSTRQLPPFSYVALLLSAFFSLGLICREFSCGRFYFSPC